MALTRVERERISDSRLKVQSIVNSLRHVQPHKVPHFDDIENCLEDAEKSLDEALQPSQPNSGTPEK